MMKTATMFLIASACLLVPTIVYGMLGNSRQTLDRALFDCDTTKLTALLTDYPSLAHFRNSIDYTPLHALAGKLFCSDCLLQLNPTITPEHQATLKQKYVAIQDMIRLLVQHGADINALKSTKIGVNKHQAETPLLHACRHSCALTIATLLACGADAKACNADGENALDLIVRRKNLASHCLERAIALLQQYSAQ